MFLLPKISSNLRSLLVITSERGTLAVHILAAVILISRLFLHSSPFSAHPRLFSVMYRSLSSCTCCFSCLVDCEDITTFLWRQKERESESWRERKREPERTKGACYDCCRKIECLNVLCGDAVMFVRLALLLFRLTR